MSRGELVRFCGADVLRSGGSRGVSFCSRLSKWRVLRLSSKSGSFGSIFPFTPPNSPSADPLPALPPFFSLPTLRPPNTPFQRPILTPNPTSNLELLKSATKYGKNLKSIVVTGSINSITYGTADQVTGRVFTNKDYLPVTPHPPKNIIYIPSNPLVIITDNHRRSPRHKSLLHKLLDLQKILRTRPVGLRRKRKPPLRRHGIPTVLDLRPANPLCFGCQEH